MVTICIHGFQPGQCASCRPVAGAAPAVDATGDSEERQGWEISYVPAVSGWQVRAPEAATLPDSYRSLFLARKAVDRMAANPSSAKASKRGK